MLHLTNSVGAASSREIQPSRLEAAPTFKSTCSFWITEKFKIKNRVYVASYGR
jgi:hypothetical protein